jgi:hypothetical protein
VQAQAVKFLVLVRVVRGGILQFFNHEPHEPSRTEEKPRMARKGNIGLNIYS